MKIRVGYFLLIGLLVQSCVVYQTAPVPIEQAIDHGRVKVVTTLNDEVLLKNIYLMDSIYYGGYYGQQIILDTAQIQEVYLQDMVESKRLSKKGALITGIIIIGIPALLLATAFFYVLITQPF